MKNIFRILMAVAVLFTASCAKEDISSSIGGGEANVTFTVDLPELGTRAYGNGANATLLRYFVFDASNGAELEQLRGTATTSTGKFTFTLPLLKGMKYDIALWADKNIGTEDDPKGYYEFDGRVVTVSYVNANDNDRDAFYHYEPNFDPTDPRTTSFQLYRPFAQLNAAVVDSDIVAVGKNEVNLTTSTVEVTTYTKFNLATGDVDKASETEVTFTEADMPYEAGETLKDGYKYLSMNYLLVPKAGMVSNVTFTFNNDKNIDFDASYDNVPLKQNYRTNILGKLLTASTEFTVTIEADFGTPAEVVWDGQSITEPTKNSNGAYVITSPAELAWLAASVNGTVSRAGEPMTFLGETFVLDSDINLGGQLWTPIGQSSKISVFRGTFDGQGHTISGLKVQNEDGAGLFGYVSGNIKNLTIDGAEITSHHYAGALVGWLQSVDSQAHNRCNVTNCHAKNVKVALTPDANHDNGDKAGALIGYAVRLTIENCTVENAEVTAYRDVAGLVGYLNSGSTLSNCSVANTEVVADQRPEYIEVKAPNAGKVAGSVSSAATIDNCPADNVNVTIYISGSKNKTIEISEPYNYVFENLTVKTTSGPAPAVKIEEGREVTITLVGDVVLEGQNGSGIDATNATLTLVGGNNNKLTAKGNGDRAFGIGGSGATVTLDGVNVDYVCGGHIQPLFINDSKYGKSEPEGGAAIGGAVVNILNSTITKADGGSKAAAIGAKFWESAEINIENSTILEANGGNASAGIGGSRYAGEDKYNLKINIKNSNVTATGGQYGAGIGSGYDTHCNQEDHTAINKINIDATSTVNATGGKYAAGIGTGHHSAYLTGAIAAGATVTAVSGEKFYKDSYTTAQNIGYGVMDLAREFSGANTTVTFTVAGNVIAAPKASITVNSADDFANVIAGDRVFLAENIEGNVTLPAGVTFNGNGKQINGTLIAGGDVEFVGHTKVTLFYAAYNNCTTTIGEGACLEMTGTDRTTLGGTVFNIKGTITDAKTADKTSIQPSLIIPGGFSITGGSDAELNIKNAYVKIGSTTSKNSAANGTFTINIENSIAEFTNQLTFAEPTNGKNPTFNLNVENSVLTTGTKLILAAPNCNMVVDNSTINIASYFRNSGIVNLKNGSTLTGSTIQFGENGGHDGKTVVDNSTFTITATSTGNPYDGRGTGSITAKNGAVVSVDYYKAMAISADATSTFTGTEVQ